MLNYPHKISFMVSMSIILLQPVKNFTQTNPTSVFFTNEDEYVIETTFIEKNPNFLHISTLPFISNNSVPFEFELVIPNDIISNLQELPYYFSTNSFFYSFDEDNLYVIKLDNLSNSLSAYFIKKIGDIIPLRFKSNTIQGLVFMDSEICIIELMDPVTKLRNVVGMIYSFTNDFNSIEFSNGNSLFRIKKDFIEDIDCNVNFAFLESCFVRYCESNTSQNNFVYSWKISPEPLELMPLKTQYLEQVQLIIKDSELSIFYLTNYHLRNLQITENGNYKDILLAVGVRSFHSVNFSKVYYISTDYRVVLLNPSVFEIYSLPSPCEGIIFQEIDDLFFVCVSNKKKQDSTTMTFFLVVNNFSQFIKVPYLRYLRIINLPRQKKLAFVYKFFDSSPTKLQIVKISKIATKMAIPLNDFHTMHTCPFYMDNCFQFQVNYHDSRQINFYKINYNETLSYSKYFGFLIASPSLKYFDWKFIRQENYFFLDDYVDGFIKNVKLSPHTSPELVLNSIHTPRYDVKLLDLLSFYCFYNQNDIIIKSGIFATSQNIITYTVYSGISSGFYTFL